VNKIYLLPLLLLISCSTPDPYQRLHTAYTTYNTDALAQASYDSTHTPQFSHDDQRAKAYDSLNHSREDMKNMLPPTIIEMAVTRAESDVALYDKSLSLVTKP